MSKLPGDSTFSIRKVFKGASIYSIGDVLTKASGFLLIPIYTRILTPYDYGIVGYLQVFLQIASVLLAFGFHGAQTRYYYEHESDRKALGQFMFTINSVSVTAGLVIFLPLVVLGRMFGWTIGSQGIPFHPYLTVTFGTVIASVVANNISSYYRMRQQFFKASVLNLSSFIVTTAFTILFVVNQGMGAFGRVLGNFLGPTIILVVTLWFYARHFVWKFSKRALIYALGFGGPIVVHLLLGTMHNSIDRVMLERFISMDDLGIYSLAISISSAFQMFVTAFNQAYQPSYYQLMESHDAGREQTIIKTFKVWLALITSMTIGGILLGGPFLSVFAGEKFAPVIDILPYLLVSVYGGSFYFFFSSAIFYFKKTKILPLITGSSALMNVTLNVLLIPRFGLTGAAVATICSHGLTSVLSYFYGNRLCKIHWPLGMILGSIILVLVTLLWFV